MTRQYWRASNLLNPVPAVLISCADENGKPNVMTAAWAGTICSDPVMVSVSIRKQRYSHDIIARTGEFVMNLSTKKLAKVTDFVGVRSGRDIDKFALEGEMKLTPYPSRFVKAPGIEESPVSLECKVVQVLELGTHDMFIAKVLSTNVDDTYLDENGKLDLKKAELIAYNHGEYYELGKLLGTFGYSVRKKKKKKRKKQTF
ncbi:MAG: flavin reductase family protein [Erysipelotrichaceae bacterium]|nr:flavin reductase family protein [Erysipelotrichaceae bacterium]